MLGGSYSSRPTIELWGRTLRWLERLRALSGRPLYNASHDYSVAWEVSDHALAVFGCCDAMRDWLRKSDETLAMAVKALYASPSLRACRDIVNTSKHLWIDDRHFAARPFTEAEVALIAEERRRQQATEMWPEEFQTTTEPFFVVIGIPPRLRVIFPGTDTHSLDLIQLCEGCVGEIGAFVEERGLLPRHEGERRSYGYPRK